MQHYNIFVIGFPKSGTTSLQTAFTKSGITSYHQRYKKHFQIGDILYENYFRTGNIFSSFDNPIAVTQSDYINETIAVYPQLDYNLLHSTFEKSNIKFILNYRNPKNIISSIDRWKNNARQRMINANIPGLPSGFGKEDIELEKWIISHFNYCRKHFSFNNDKFIEIDIEADGVKTKLSNFLEMDIKWWGQANKNA